MPRKKRKPTRNCQRHQRLAANNKQALRTAGWYATLIGCLACLVLASTPVEAFAALCALFGTLTQAASG